MRTRSVANLYNAAARLWLLGAGGSLLLPASARLGSWLPLHLALVGAVSVAISGNMTSFAGALTAAPGPAPVVVWVQFGLINAGVGIIAYAYPAGRSALVAAGGACFVAGLVLLLTIAWNAWRKGLNRRHHLPMFLYGVAVCCVVAGGTLGALLGGGAVAGSSFEALRNAHLTLNVLGWTSITIVATLMTLLPTVLRIRMLRWGAPAAAACLVLGVGLLAGGLAARVRLVSTSGAIIYWGAGIQVAIMAGRALGGRRNWPVPVAAKHMVCALAWYVGGGSALVWACARGSSDGFVLVLELTFVCGWILQTLVGSWLYLLPVGRPGGPAERRGWLTAVEVGANAQVAVMNLGLALLVLGKVGLLPGTAEAIGGWAALAAAAAALLKSWAYAPLARIPAVVRRSDERWAGRG